MNKKTIAAVIGSFLIVTSICQFCVFLVFLTTGRLGYDFSEVKITKFTLCSREDILLEKPSNMSPSINLGTETIYVCGYLNTKAPIDFEVFFFEGDAERAFMHDGVNWVDQGFFYKEFNLPVEIRSGNYRIEAYFMRKILASNYFSIIEQNR